MEQGKLFKMDVAAVPEKKAAGGKHWLINSLLNGLYLADRNGKLCLFDLKQSPIRYLSKIDVAEVYALLRKKKTKYGTRYFINRSEVRALHGNSVMKKQYRKFKAKQKLLITKNTTHGIRCNAPETGI